MANCFNIHKIPGVFVVAFHGKFGSGKTLSMLEHGLSLANATRRSIVANFKLRRGGIKAYAKKHDLKFLQSNFFTCEYQPDIIKLMYSKNKVILFDEAGVDLFARAFKSHNKELFDRLFRIRHYKNYLLYASQMAGQVDSQFRAMTHLVIDCRGLQRYDENLGFNRLYVQFALAYDKPIYDILDSNPQLKTKNIYPLWKANFRYILRVPSLDDLFSRMSGTRGDLQLLFESYDSHDSRKLGDDDYHHFRWIDWNPSIYSQLVAAGKIRDVI